MVDPYPSWTGPPYPVDGQIVSRRRATNQNWASSEEIKLSDKHHEGKTASVFKERNQIEIKRGKKRVGRDQIARKDINKTASVSGHSDTKQTKKQRTNQSGCRRAVCYIAGPYKFGAAHRVYVCYEK